MGALLCGAVCAWDGPKLWEALVITTLALGAAWVLHFEAKSDIVATGDISRNLYFHSKLK